MGWFDSFTQKYSIAADRVMVQDMMHKTLQLGSLHCQSCMKHTFHVQIYNNTTTCNVKGDKNVSVKLSTMTTDKILGSQVLRTWGKRSRNSRDTEITQEYCESLVSSMLCCIQAVIDRKEGHTKYWKVVTLTLLDVFKFQIVLYYAFGEINVYDLVWRPK